MAKIVKRSLRGTESEKMVCANLRVFRDQAQALWGGYPGLIGGVEFNESLRPPDVVDLGWPTNSWK